MGIRRRRRAGRFLSKALLVWLVFVSCCPTSRAAEETLSGFVTIGVAEGLPNNIVNAIYKDRRGFVWLGTQLGLGRFDGVTVVSYPQLKDCSVFDICETDSVFLWIGTDKGLVCLNRRTETITYLLTENSPVVVKTLYPLSDGRLLVGTTQGLFVYGDGKSEKVIFEPNALSTTNSLSRIVQGEVKNTFWITSQNGLIYYDLNTRLHRVHKFPSPDNTMNAFSTLVCIGRKIYVGRRSQGLVVFDIPSQMFEPFPYDGNPYITTLSVAGENELYVGTNGGGLLRISSETGKIISVVEHDADAQGISSNAVYSFLKDGDIFWIGTYMGGVNYNPQYEHQFRLYAFRSRMDSRKYNVRSFWIGNDGRKIIGTRNNGLIYVSEKENIVKQFISSTSVLRTNLILAVYPLDEREFLIGTYGGGLYRFDAPTATLRAFHEDHCFNEGTFSGFLRDGDGKLWIGSSGGVYIYDTETGHYTRYNNTNSALISQSIFFITMDSHNRMWLGTGGGVHFYDFATRTFHSDIFPDPFRSFTRSVRYIYEDAEKNLWFCDDKEGVVKVDEHFEHFEHFTDVDFLPCNSVTSITEDRDGGMWFASQKGLVCRRGKDVTFYSTYNGIPGHVFNTTVQQTADGSLWWGNEEGLVYFDPHAVGDESPAAVKSPLPAITAITVSGKTLNTGDKIMPFAPPFTTDINISQGNSIELAFTALNYSPVNASVYEYRLEGYDREWRTLSAGNKVSYADLPRGKYVFGVRFLSDLDAVTSIRVNVYREVTSVTWFIAAGAVFIIYLLYSYSRLLNKYRAVKRRLTTDSNPKEKYLKARMGGNEVDRIQKKLIEYMQTGKPYLNPDLKLQEVAAAIGCTSVDVSQVLNIYLNTNFADFINQYRVEEFLTHIQNKSAAKYTLTSLSEQSGFSSKTSFFRTFKKIKGMTPSEYVKDKRLALHE
jgi:ligand-binding sensor domain-containing protein/AraC-like DNA-binding protein